MPTITPLRSPHRFAVIGGDRRMTHAAARLSETGASVALLGAGPDGLPDTGGDFRVATTLAGAVEGATALILPLPATRDGRTVSTPRDLSVTVSFDDLAELLRRRPTLSLFGGRLPAGFAASIPPYPGTNISRVTDYYEDEALQLRNAAVTAEGALLSAMQLSESTLRGSTAAVIGYGRIGRLLCRLLLSLGADVTVAARREDARLWAQVEGAHPLRLGDAGRPGGGLYPLCYGHPVIFNTVPARVLDRDLLSRMEPGTILIDLASAPFGVADEDVREATVEGRIRYVRAPSIPGTYAPREAGRIIAESIIETMRETEKQLPDAMDPRRGGDGS